MKLTVLGKGQGYLKAGFLGFQGSGKTFTATLLAIGVRRLFKLKGPVALIDTENATEYIAPLVKDLTGADLIGARTRSFDDLLSLPRECEEAGVSALVVDSVTHFWRNLCDAYLAGVNQQRAKWNKPPRTRLEFQDWGPLKGEWAKWSDWYLNSPMHVIICGRAGYEYDMEKNEETHRNELIKTGIKMKTEAEFGFEPSLLVQMAVEQEPAKDGRFRQVRTAIVLKDRYAKIDGSVFTFGKLATHAAELEAVMTAFGPHVNMLVPGAHSTVPTGVEPLPVSEEGDVEWARERKARTILCEEIKEDILSRYPGRSDAAIKAKSDLLYEAFGTRSWTAIESMRSERLREGHAAVKQRLGLDFTPGPPEDDGGLGPTEQAAEPSQPGKEGGGETTTPAPPPTQAPAKGLDDETVLKLDQAVGPHAAAADAWMRSKGWLKKGQDISCLSQNQALKILSNPQAFLRAIGVTA